MVGRWHDFFFFFDDSPAGNAPVIEAADGLQDRVEAAWANCLNLRYLDTTQIWPPEIGVVTSHLHTSSLHRNYSQTVLELGCLTSGS